MTWQPLSLGECATFTSGGTPNKGTAEFWIGDIPWVSSGEMLEHFIHDTSLHVSEAGAHAGSRLVPAGTIFAVVRGMSLATEFRVAYATKRMAFNQDLKALTAKPGIDPYFLFSAIRANAPQIRDLATEAAHGTKKLEMDRLESFQIRVPNIDVQHRVAATVKAYDDLIENNRRRIQLLEEAARLMYREWFMALRFHGHERVSLLNGVPQGWQRVPLSSVIEINPSTRPTRDGEHPFVAMHALSESSMVIGDPDMRVPNGGAKFRNGDTLLARITPCLENGKTGFVQFLPTAQHMASGSTEFIVMRPSESSPYWVYCLARDEKFRSHAIRSMVGSDGRQRVNTKLFDQYQVLKPPKAVFDAFDRFAAPVFSQVQALSRQSQVLKKARDALLPRLMSGALPL